MKRQTLFALIICCSLAGLAFYRSHVPAPSAEKLVPIKLSHLAIIMDGNRRWARERNLESWRGHQEGVNPLRMAAELCIEYGIPYLSVYAFSLENFKRSEEEKRYLFDVLAQELVKNELASLGQKGVKIQFIGDRKQFPESLRAVIRDVEQRTVDGNKLTLNLLFCYGGRQEITSAAREIAQKIIDGNLRIDDISDATISEFLWTAGTPDPDLIIRTGKVHRLSNFLPFQGVYAEIEFLDKYWPDVTREDLETVFEAFAQSKRTFGA